LSNSVSIIRIIIPRCHEHFKSLDLRAGYGEDYTRYTMIGLCLLSSTSDFGNIGDLF
jgi:hypothetical protein